MQITGSTRVQIRTDCYTSSVDGDLIVFDERTGKYFGSSPVGNKIWELATTEVSVQDLCRGLMKDFSVDYETCEADVISFLEQLHRAGLLNLVDK